MPIVQCSAIENVSWKHKADLSPIKDFVHCYRLSIPANTIHVPAAKALLSKDERARAARYFHQKDRDRFILARAALRLILSGYIGIPARSIVFTIGTNKKPFVPRAGDKQYNIAHAGDWIIIGISAAPLGVDVEGIDPQHNHSSVMDMCFSPAEIGFTRSAADPLAAFCLLWTRKEALVKATAKGMDDDFKFVPSLCGTHTVDAGIIGGGQNWNVVSFPLAKQHTASIAYSLAIENIAFFETDEIVKQMGQL